ncbi:MAG TPA: cation-transporting P-type ATPase, partial [Limnochordia bacterium]
KARVVRDGVERSIPASDVVPGDLLVLDSGDRVAADCRLVQSSAVAVDESPLTGESVPVSKRAEWKGDAASALADRKNILYMGTTLVRGRARAVAVATGMATEIGAIAGMIQDSAEAATPLQRRLGQLGRWLVAACLLTVALVFGLGVWRGLPVFRMFLLGVSLAVAAIPEGLPAVVTVALAVGVQRMIRRRAIIRRLPAVETLGCATVICSDKTGTLTQNRMVVTEFALLSGRVSVAAVDGPGTFRRGDRPIDPADHPDLCWALRAAALCNHATVRHGPDRLEVLGDPTEAALLIAARAGGFGRRESLAAGPILGELPFDSERRRMSVVVRAPSGWGLPATAGRGERCVALVKGAPDAVIARCEKVLRGGEVRPLREDQALAMQRLAAQLAGQALRVLALAFRDLGPRQAPLPDPPPEALVESQLVLIGLVAMADPPRPEAAGAIAQARRAGVRTLMVTGDHAATAAAIGRALGLCAPGDEAVLGEAIERASPAERRELLRRSNVFARVSPKQKLLIVRTLRADGEVVAMTGDGVNDAPAVKEADIGIAMGQAGTDVTKEAAAMVLADDHYATIVAAIEEGRGIYENIRKFIRYLLGCNVGEVLTMLVATLAGLPLPLLPIQILWMNLVTDGLPALALGVDPPEPGLMERPPRRPDEGIFARRLHRRILWRGLLISVCTLASFLVALQADPEGLSRARTMAFTTLVMSQLCYVFQCRSERRSAFEVGWASNWLLIAAVGISALMQVAVLYLAPLQRIFGTVGLTAEDWLVVGVLSGWSLGFDGFARAVRAAFWRRLSVIRVRC